MDALPWSSWHVRLVVALGVAWLLDGLEGSLAGSLAGALQSSSGLRLTESDLGLSSSIYLAGAVLGSLVFGALADRFGRKRLFLVTLTLYLTFTTLTAGTWSLASFTVCRFFTGAGIGGEYAAINSAIDELVPARYRGQVNLAINGTFWLGIMLGSAGSSVLMSPRLFGAGTGWRVAFLVGLPIGLVVLYLRRNIPESPRWLVAHHRLFEANEIVGSLDSRSVRALDMFSDVSLQHAPQMAGPAPLAWDGVRHIFYVLRRSRSRALICLLLMTSQAFLYNSVFFSLTLVLLRYDHVSSSHVGYAFLPIALANFAGPLLMGRAIDSLGRKPVIAGTYAVSGLLVLVQGVFLLVPSFGVATHLVGWMALFVFASTAASSAYLTVSELFPQEMRALAIAIFYAFGTLLGGVLGPLVFGRIVSSGSPKELFVGYAIAAVLMLGAGGVQAIWGTAAERSSLESLQELP